MSTDRKHQAPTVAPGEPEAPVADTTPPPAPAEPQLPASEEDEYAAVAAGEPEAPVGPSVAASEESSPQSEAVDLEALTAKAEKADEYLQLAQRTKADFENYRKRALREAAAAQDRGVAKLAMELLPAVDNLDRALEAADT